MANSLSENFISQRLMVLSPRSITMSIWAARSAAPASLLLRQDYEKILRNKIVRFREETKTRKSIQLTFISSYGLQRNMYSGIAQNEVVLNDLF